MKKLITGAALAVALIGFAPQAGATACSASPILVSLATACEIGNMEFSAFTTTGSPDLANLSVTYGITNLGQTQYVVNFNDANDMTANFTISYTVTVDQATFPANGDGAWAVNAVGGGMQADGTSTSSNQATLTKTVTAITGTGSGSFTVVQNGAIQTNNGPLAPLADKSATILDQFSYTSGGIQNISNSFSELDTTAPEPMTFSLMGAGLLGLGLLRKRLS